MPDNNVMNVIHVTVPMKSRRLFFKSQTVIIYIIYASTLLQLALPYAKATQSSSSTLIVDMSILIDLEMSMAR